MRYATLSQRVGIQKGQLLRHAMATEVLGITGDNKDMARNAGKTIVFRRFLPYGATTTNSTTINTISVDVLAHETDDGVTPEAESVLAQDITVTMKQYACLYDYTDQTADFHEDDIPMAQREQCGERMGLLREMIRYGVIKGCTNKYYAGGTSRSTVDERLSLGLLRNITRGLMANRCKMITSVLAPSPNYSTAPVEASFLVFAHTDLEQDIRDLPGFIPAPSYGQRKTVHENELGSCERYRFVLSAELAPILAGGASVTGTGLYSVGGSNVDIYPVLVVGRDSWGDVALRGSKSLDVTHIKPGQKDSADPLGQRGYVGAKFYAAATMLNDGWAAVAEVGITALS